jgi:inosose dehydratase
MGQVVGVQGFHWSQYWSDQGKRLQDNLDETFSIVRDAGFDYFEPLLERDSDLATIGSSLKRSGLKVATAYAGVTLHHEDWKQEADRLITLAKWAKDIGASILVTNPDPIDWNAPKEKSDLELQSQADALNHLTAELAGLGVTLAYHVHSSELRSGAREMHHMLLATRATNMGFCLDFHWIYRGCGNSQLAVSDIITLYGNRVVSTHIRQSHDGIWSETLEEGDLNYTLISAEMKALNFTGPWIVECAREVGSERADSMINAYSSSREWVLKTLV